MKQIKIKVGELEIPVELNDTKIALAIWGKLPIKAQVNTWGQEIYFSIPVIEKNLENPKKVVQIGDLGYWPPGNAFCIFFGQTPASTENEIRPASQVEIIGKFRAAPEQLKKISDGEIIIIEKS